MSGSRTFIPFEDLGQLNARFARALEEQFRNVLDGGQFVLGQQLERFEEEFARYCQTTYCVGVSSGLDALRLTLIALQLPPGSEVIVPAHTYIATWLAVVQAGLKPVPVEPDPDTYNIDPERVADAISPQSRALLVVHLYGRLAQMDKLQTLARQHKLYLIEDAAQAHGARFRGKRAGSFGAAAAFSFYPSKNLGALGDGGAITTNDAALAARLRRLRNYGAVQKYRYQEQGYNARLDELQAAFLRIKLARLDEINTHKRRLAALYRKGLHERFSCTTSHPDFEEVHHIFPIRHPRRDDLKNRLMEYGIGTGIHYPVPPHRQPAFEAMALTLPITEALHATELSLPISYIHSENDIQYVLAVLNALA